MAIDASELPERRPRPRRRDEDERGRDHGSGRRDRDRHRHRRGGETPHVQQRNGHRSSPAAHLTPTNPSDVAFARRMARLEMAMELSNERRRRESEMDRLCAERRERERRLELAEMRAESEVRNSARFAHHRGRR